jgi:hypothetical protein
MARRGDGWLQAVATLLQGYAAVKPLDDKALHTCYCIADQIDHERRNRNRSDHAAGLRDDEE